MTNEKEIKQSPSTAIKWPEKITLCPHGSVNPKRLCTNCLDINETLEACRQAVEAAGVRKVGYPGKYNPYPKVTGEVLLGFNSRDLQYQYGWNAAIDEMKRLNEKKG